MWQKTLEYHYRGSFSIGGHSHNPGFVPLLGFGVGLGLFANGFLTYRKLRVVEDTPRIPVRSIPMGLVRVHGKVTGSFLLASPVAHIPCYHYRVQVEHWEEQGKNRGWHIVHTEKDQRNFYLDDGTGKVMIRPQSGEFDLPATYRAEIGPRAMNVPYLDPSLSLANVPSEQELRAYAAKVNRPLFVGNPSSVAKLEAKYAQAMEGENPVTGRGSFRITEYCLVAEHEYDVIGTCAENPQPQDDQDRNVILKGQNEPTFVISGLSERTLEKALRKRALTRIFLGGLLMVLMMAFIIGNLLKS
jgi:hypothetical protein